MVGNNVICFHPASYYSRLRPEQSRSALARPPVKSRDIERYDLGWQRICHGKHTRLSAEHLPEWPHGFIEILPAGAARY